MKNFLPKLLTCYIKDKKERKASRDCLIAGYRYLNPKKIKLIMTLLVKDEEEIVETNIRFHCAMGVDGVIVTDNGSTDRTLEILEKLKKEGLVLDIIKEPSTDYKQDAWVDRMIRLAKKKYKATWVINADADEFYYSQDLNLKESIAKYPNVNALKLNTRMSFGTNYEQIFDNHWFVINPLKDFEYDLLNFEHNRFTDYFSRENFLTCPKVLHATKGYKKNVKGNHGVIMKKLVMASSEDIICYHFHMTNYKRYEDKGKRYILCAHKLTSGENYITDIIKRLQNGTLRKYWDSFYGEDMKNLLEKHGVIHKDYSVYNFLKYNNIIK